jgi:hypothetical protein
VVELARTTASDQQSGTWVKHGSDSHRKNARGSARRIPDEVAFEATH